MKRVLTGASLLVLSSCSVFGQSAPPAFEVASIKPAAPQEMGRIMTRMGGDAGRVDYANVSLKDVLARAYGVKRYQVSGPSWLDTERYDITAKVPEGVPESQVPAMLQALLAERFKMVIHKDSKEESVYGLVVGKGGPKLVKAEKRDDAAPMTLSRGGPGGPGGPVPRIGGGRGMMMISGPGGNVKLQANDATVSQFTDMLSNMLGQPVVDMTGIQGNYDFALDVSMEEMAGMRRLTEGVRAAAGVPLAGAPAAEAPAPGASIFTAVQAYGLKLESKKAPVERIVVDKGDKVPTDN